MNTTKNNFLAPICFALENSLDCLNSFDNLSLHKQSIDNENLGVIMVVATSIKENTHEIATIKQYPTQQIKTIKDLIFSRVIFIKIFKSFDSQSRDFLVCKFLN